MIGSCHEAFGPPTKNVRKVPGNHAPLWITPVLATSGFVAAILQQARSIFGFVCGEPATPLVAIQNRIDSACWSRPAQLALAHHAHSHLEHPNQALPPGDATT